MISRVAAVSDPMPKTLTKAGDAVRVSHDNSTFRPWIS